MQARQQAEEEARKLEGGGESKKEQPAGAELSGPGAVKSVRMSMANLSIGGGENGSIGGPGPDADDDERSVNSRTLMPADANSPQRAVDSPRRGGKDQPRVIIHELLRRQLHAFGNPMVNPAQSGSLTKFPHIASPWAEEIFMTVFKRYSSHGLMSLEGWIDFMEDADFLSIYTPHDMHGEIRESFRQMFDPIKIFETVAIVSLESPPSRYCATPRPRHAVSRSLATQGGQRGGGPVVRELHSLFPNAAPRVLHRLPQLGRDQLDSGIP